MLGGGLGPFNFRGKVTGLFAERTCVPTLPPGLVDICLLSQGLSRLIHGGLFLLLAIPTRVRFVPTSHGFIVHYCPAVPCTGTPHCSGLSDGSELEATPAGRHGASSA